MLLNAIVENVHERAYYEMMNNLNIKDDIEAEINNLSTELYDELSDDDYLEIEDKIRIAFGWNDINPDVVEAALRAICYAEAEYRFNKKNKRSFY